MTSTAALSRDFLEMAFGAEVNLLAVRPRNYNPAADFTGDNRPLFSYIWICERKSDADSDGPPCRIGLHQFQYALANANRYRQADFMIWIDRKITDKASAAWLQFLVDATAHHGNIRICDLQEIPAYADDPFFAVLAPARPDLDPHRTYAPVRNGPGNVYSRADYARILVLDHCMQAYSGRSRIIYSDLDCRDVRLYDVAHIIDTYGIAVHNPVGGYTSHGFIGLNPGNDQVKRHYPQLVAETRAAAHDHQLGFSCFKEFLERIGKPFRDWRNHIGIMYLLPEVAERIPASPLLRELGINN